MPHMPYQRALIQIDFSPYNTAADAERGHAEMVANG